MNLLIHWRSSYVNYIVSNLILSSIIFKNFFESEKNIINKKKLNKKAFKTKAYAEILFKLFIISPINHTAFIIT
jgi:hypothetical protein